MSAGAGGEEMVFGDVAFREPRPLRRPDRDGDWACLPYETPAPGDLPIFLDRAAADRIERHALRDTSVELGGILLGRECVDDRTREPFVWVTQALEAKHFENTQASFTYTHDSWEEISRERDRLHPSLDIVGWYHTHPNFGVFLSGHDRFIHEHFFAQPLQVAYVVDPVRQTRGFFRWRDGSLLEVGGYYLTASRGERVALARTLDDLEGRIGHDGPSTTLSPLLEAELMAALTRTHSAPATTSADSPWIVLAGSLGAVAGALILGAGLWLSSLAAQVRQQSQALEAIGRATAADRNEAARLSGKAEALDALLGRVEAGGLKGKASEVLERLIRERDEALAENRRKSSVFNQFADEVGRLRDTSAGQKARITELAERLQKAEDAARDPGSATPDTLTEAGRGLTWYVAAGGWATSLILALVLIASLLRGRPDASPIPTPDDRPSL